MNKILTRLLIICILINLPVQYAFAQKAGADFGKQEFESRCASCHDKDGKGNGWLSYFLNVQTPDLTTLAKKNGGILPIDRLYQNIAGEGVLIHGPSDMPAWGRTYKQEAPDIYLGVPYNSEMYSRGRILLLIEYINRLQVK